MKKVLFVAHVESHILHFHIPYLKLFHETGYEVHVATNGESMIPYCDVKHNLPFQKSPLKTANFIAYKNLKNILNIEKFDIIHCHTPVGGVIARLANRFSKNYKYTKMIYTAHGFHFYQGAPLINWIIYYPIEWWLSRYVDVLITINMEDFNSAKNFKTKKLGSIQLVNGVGIDNSKFDFPFGKEDRLKYRNKLGLEPSDFIMIFPAELNKNKNQIFLINCMEKLVLKKKNIKLLLPGQDLLNEKLQNLVYEKKLEKNVLFLGYRNDIPILLKISDLAVSSSKREGLPLNLIEASYCKLPILSSNCRGNREFLSTYINEDDFIKKVLNHEYTTFEDYHKYLLSATVVAYKDIYFRGVK